jgi:hypothetical protein
MNKNHRGVYTPQINEESVFLLRRVAWAAEQPMTLTLDACIQNLVSRLDRKAVCSACIDRRCLECPISSQVKRKELDRVLI